jgi:dolichol-phosphate mannosyltransferase
MSDRVLVIVPTYNEAENVERIVERLQASVPEAHALVVDDGSPDGTGELADKLAARDPRVHVLRRSGKAGLGPAYVAGFSWALEHGYDVVVEMDADGSHAPEQLPRLLAALEGSDLVLGSRYVPGGWVEDWPVHRLVLSRLGNRYTRWLLRLPLSDATGGYRAARAELIDRLPFDDVASHGYCFQVDWAWRAVRAGARVTEVPITFTERAFGRSKMSGSIVREALVRVTVWGLKDRLADRLPDRVRRPVPGRARDGGRSSTAR